MCSMNMMVRSPHLGVHDAVTDFWHIAPSLSGADSLGVSRADSKPFAVRLRVGVLRLFTYCVA